MSDLATTDPERLRPLLLLEWEAKRLFAAMAADAEADRIAGKHDPALGDVRPILVPFDLRQP